jgi:hypothetical protein
LFFHNYLKKIIIIHKNYVLYKLFHIRHRDWIKINNNSNRYNLYEKMARIHNKCEKWAHNEKNVPVHIYVRQKLIEKKEDK